MERQKRFFLTNLVYFLSFIIPVLILLLIYILRSIYPFGDEVFLRSDMYHQYAPFLAAFQEKLKTGGSLAYSWDIGGGVNFVALYAYYLATPINWILFLFPQSILTELMSIILILKIGLSGFTFSYYICKHFNTNNPAVGAFAIFYALSAYVAAYSWNVMWLDCIWLLPLILLGLEYLVKGKKPFLYCIALGISILSNYYISIMICIFCVLYFFMLMLSQPEAKENPYKKIFSFGLFSLLAGGLAAILLIPEFFALQLTVSGEMNFPESLTKYFSILEMVSRQLMLVEPAVFSAHEPNIYSGIPIFLLVPLYAMNSKVNLKEKIGKFILVFIFYISFNMNILNYIWHGFHFPNSLPCRQSFIFNFLLLSMAYEGLCGIKKYTAKQVYGTLAGVIALFLMIEHFIAGDEYHFSIVYVSLLFACLYCMLIELYRKKRLANVSLCLLLFLIVFMEAFINTEETSVSTTNRTSYVSDNTAITSVLDELYSMDTDFYRVEKLKRRTKNDSAWHHYHGLSLFSSTANAGLSQFLSDMGHEESTNSYAFYGATPLTTSLLNVKYVFSNDFLENTSLRELVTWDESIYLYENKYTLPLGFLIPSDLNESWDMISSNPFTVQNDFASLTTGIDPIFTTINYSTSGNKVEIHVKEDQYVYAYVTSSGEDFVATYTDESNEEIQESKSFNGVKQKYIFELGYCLEGTTITLSATEEDSIKIYTGGLELENFETYYKMISEQELIIDSYDDTHVNGTITVKEDGVLFTSIIYEKGWSVTVDGYPVDTTAFKDAFISIPLAAGIHEVKFSYIPYGLPAGILISTISFGILSTIIIGTRIRGKRKDRQIQKEEVETSKE
ncbi:MAG: YfhO family protein [Clostridiales bacterium]|nr:YfhO family protein [Clostridiales bacterium]